MQRYEKLGPCLYGTAEPVWHLCVDEADSMLYPDPTPETIALTSGWDSIKDLYV